MIRAVAYAVSLVVLGAAATLVPLPLIEYLPGAATPISPLVEIDGRETTPITGELSLLTVLVRQPTLTQTIEALTSPVGDLQLRDDVIPAGVEEQEYFETQRRQFARSFDVAAAVGARAAGVEVDIGTAAFVVAVLPDGPSDGTLLEGDVIVALDGEPVSGADELIRLLRPDVEVGDRLDVTVERGAETMALTVTAGRAPGMEAPGFGILVETVAEDIELPFEVELGDTDIGGPSAGMMIALTVYDLLADADVTDRRRIVGTGTISTDGRIGPIGGVEEKVAAAEREGAAVMLVPAAQAADAAAVADDDLEVVAVETLQDAIDALAT